MSSETAYTCDFCGLEERTAMGDSPPGWDYSDVDLCPACKADRTAARAQVDHELRHMPKGASKMVSIVLSKRP